MAPKDLCRPELVAEDMGHENVAQPVRSMWNPLGWFHASSRVTSGNRPAVRLGKLASPERNLASIGTSSVIPLAPLLPGSTDDRMAHVREYFASLGLASRVIGEPDQHRGQPPDQDQGFENEDFGDILDISPTDLVPFRPQAAHLLASSPAEEVAGTKQHPKKASTV